MENINYDDKSKIVNLAYKEIYIKRFREDTVGVKIPANGSYRMKNSDILELIQDDYKFFTGIDGQGNHATVYVDNPEIRKEVYFDNEEDGIKQQVLDKEEINRILNLKTMDAFKKNLKEKVVTVYEKYAIIKEASLKKFNDGAKIRALEEHTGYDYYNLNQVVIP